MELEVQVKLLEMKLELLQQENTILQNKLKLQAVPVLKMKKGKPTVILFQDNPYILDLQNRKLVDKFKQQQKDKVN